jgi:hypothetical protein
MWEQMQLVFDQSFERINATLVTMVPGILAMLLILVLAFLVAAGVRVLLRRSLARMGFDRRAQSWGLTSGAELDAQHAPSLLVARGAYWLVVLLGVALALDVFGASTTSALGLSLLAFLPRLVVGAIIFLVGVGASRFLERSVLISAVNMQIQAARLLALGVKWLVLVLATAMALEHVGIGGLLVTISFAILLGGIVLALALAVGLGSRDVVTRQLEKRIQQDQRAKTEERQISHL